jgi:hypothetical protein
MYVCMYVCMYGELRHPLRAIKSGFYVTSCTVYMKSPAELWLCIIGQKLVASVGREIMVQICLPLLL